MVPEFLYICETKIIWFEDDKVEQEYANSVTKTRGLTFISTTAAPRVQPYYSCVVTLEDHEGEKMEHRCRRLSQSKNC